MSGLDAAAAAAQVVSLAFQLFHGCIDAYRFCHAAQRIGKDGEFLRLKIQIERDRLERWADRVGLANEKPDDRLNWAVILGILRLQQDLLTSAEKLKKRYGLAVTPLDPECDRCEIEGNLKGAAAPTSGLERILEAVRPELYANSHYKVIAAANDPVKRLRWASVGREKLIKIVDDLGSLNSDLERLLEKSDREWLRSSVSLLLRDLLSRSTDVGEIELLQELLRPKSSTEGGPLLAAANFKRVRLVLGVDKREDEIQPKQSSSLIESMPVLKMLKRHRLSPQNGSDRVGLQFAKYQSSSVLVEWRQSDSRNKVNLLERMQELALLLGSTDASFATLHCMGLLGTDASASFGLVYEIPPLPGSDPSAGYEHRTLHALIASQAKVSLKTRRGIASAMAEAILQLHTAGWLHKDLRSENVIFIGSSASDSKGFLSGTPYLVGYDIARPDQEGTVTEMLDSKPSIELYYDPQRRGTKSRYVKRFDLFAMACLLVEIALWEHLVDIYARHTTSDWTSRIRDAEIRGTDLRLPSLYDLLSEGLFIEEVDHAVGPRYLQAIQLCLSGRTGTEDRDTSLEIQTNIVDLLRWRCT